MGAYDTWDGMIRLAQDYGPYARTITQKSGSASTVTGVIPQTRFEPIVLPSSFASGVKGIRFVNIGSKISNSNMMMLVGLEYLLGSVNLATGTFTDGVAMPTKLINGESITTAAMWTFLAVTTTLSATSPIITVTYTNEVGTASRSVATTMPSNSNVGTAMFLNTNLQGDDFAIRDVTGITKSAGSSGVVSVYGYLPLHFSRTSFQSNSNVSRMADSSLPLFIGEASEKIGFIGMGQEGYVGGITMVCNLYGLPEL